MATACHSSPRRPRLVLLYATCSVNKSFLWPYAPAVTYTPRLRAFAARAVTFDRQQTESGQSGVAFAALFSGSQAMHHGVYRHPAAIRPGVELISEAFARAGWSTHAWLNHRMANASLGYAQGVPPAHSSDELLTGEDPAFGALLDSLVREPQARAYVVTNFSVTHFPYSTRHLARFCAVHPDECGARADLGRFDQLSREYRAHHLEFAYDFERAIARRGFSARDVGDLAAVVELLYKSNVARLDELFGGVLDAIRERGLLDESLIVFTADHGEVLYREHALFKWGHGFQLAPEVLEVPLVVRAPDLGVRPGRYAAVSRSIDVLPTLLDLAGLPVTQGPGRDLAPALRLEEPAPELVAFSHTSLFAPPTWERYRNYPGITRYFPDLDPELMWVAARSHQEQAERLRALGYIQ